MTRPDQHRAHPHDPDADRLSAAWNEIVAGLEPFAEDELTATARSLHAGAPDHRPTSTFRDDLRETLMETAVPIEMPALRQPPRLREQASESRLRIPSIMGGRAVRWTAIAATVALLLTTLTAGYLSGLYPPDRGPEPTRNVAAPNTGTPTAGTLVAHDCVDVPRYFQCGATSSVGVGMVVPGKVQADALDVTKAQLQGWEVDGAETVSFSAPKSALTGMAVDVVVVGAYQATFSVPVAVARAYPGGNYSWEYPDAGTVIELSRGDSVTYQIGTKTEVRNAFEAETLKFKTILFYEGDPSPENTAGGGGFRARIDGDGTLPKPLGELGSPEVHVQLSYVTLAEGEAPPTGTRFITPVFGPVASTQALGGPNEGFVVWVSTNAGRG